MQDSLTARLDRLAPVKEVAQIGAAIGREFSYPLLRAVAGRAEQLEDVELLFRSGVPPDARYTFKLALVQDTAHETLLRGCEGIAGGLEQHRASFEASLREAPQDEDIS